MLKTNLNNFKIITYKKHSFFKNTDRFKTLIFAKFISEVFVLTVFFGSFGTYLTKQLWNYKKTVLKTKTDLLKTESDLLKSKDILDFSRETGANPEDIKLDSDWSPKFSLDSLYEALEYDQDLNTKQYRRLIFKMVLDVYPNAFDGMVYLKNIKPYLDLIKNPSNFTLEGLVEDLLEKYSLLKTPENVIQNYKSHIFRILNDYVNPQTIEDWEKINVLRSLIELEVKNLNTNIDQSLLKPLEYLYLDNWIFYKVEFQNYSLCRMYQSVHTMINNYDPFSWISDIRNINPNSELFYFHKNPLIEKILKLADERDVLLKKEAFFDGTVTPIYNFVYTHIHNFLCHFPWDSWSGPWF